MNIVNAFLNLILVSISEELFITCMALILLKRFDLLDIKIWKQNLKWIMLPVLVMAIDINLTKYIFQLPKIFCSLSALILYIISFTYMININSYNLNKKYYTKIIICILSSFIIFSLLEGSTYPILLYLMHKPLNCFVNNIPWNFICSLPSRILGFLLIVYLIIHHNNVVNIKIFEVISKNKFLFWSILSFAITSNIFSLYIFKLIGVDRILDNKISLFQQTFIIMGALIIPSIILFWVILLINYILVKERQIQQSYQNLVIQDDVMADVDNIYERRDS